MKSRLAIIGLIAASLVAATGQPARSGNAEQSLATIIVIPPEGTPKTAIRILGAGFRPGEEVKAGLVIDGVQTAVGYREKVNGERKRKHIADENGTFRILSAIPRGVLVKPGVYAVTATGDMGSKAVFPVEVQEKK